MQNTAFKIRMKTFLFKAYGQAWIRAGPVWVQEDLVLTFFFLCEPNSGEVSLSVLHFRFFSDLGSFLF